MVGTTIDCLHIGKCPLLDVQLCCESILCSKWKCEYYLSMHYNATENNNPVVLLTSVVKNRQEHLFLLQVNSDFPLENNCFPRGSILTDLDLGYGSFSAWDINIINGWLCSLWFWFINQGYLCFSSCSYVYLCVVVWCFFGLIHFIKEIENGCFTTNVDAMQPFQSKLHWAVCSRLPSTD